MRKKEADFFPEILCDVNIYPFLKQLSLRRKGFLIKEFNKLKMLERA